MKPMNGTNEQYITKNTTNKVKKKCPEKLPESEKDK